MYPRQFQRKAPLRDGRLNQTQGCGMRLCCPELAGNGSDARPASDFAPSPKIDTPSLDSHMENLLPDRAPAITPSNSVTTKVLVFSVSAGMANPTQPDVCTYQHPHFAPYTSPQPPHNEAKRKPGFASQASKIQCCAGACQ